MVLRRIGLVCLCVVLTACQFGTESPTATPSVALSVTPRPRPTVTPRPTPIPQKTIWVDPLLPADIHDALVAQLREFARRASSERQIVSITTQEHQADARITAGWFGAAGEGGQGDQGDQGQHHQQLGQRTVLHGAAAFIQRTGIG